MTNAKAQAAKDKGNSVFKNGDYPSAIGHYTQAILEDSKDWTFPLNRAAAYLKLGKNEDAERDCTTVLTLNASNVKALFRRAQARRALDKLLEAQKDLEQAVSLDPSNESAKNELSSVKDHIWKNRKSEVVHPMRRRVPIKIIEPPEPVASSSATSSSSVTVAPRKEEEESALAPKTASKPTSKTSTPASASPPLKKAVVESTTPLTSSSSSSSTPAHSPANTRQSTHKPATPSEPSSKSFQEAKRVREESATKVSRVVGGGIFRASGENTIFTPRTNGSGSGPASDSGSGSGASGIDEVVDSSSPSSTLDDKTGASAGDTWGAKVSLGKETTTLFEFTKGWNRLSESSVEERFRYIMKFHPTLYPTMIQNSLEPPLLTSMFKTFHGALDENQNQNQSEGSVAAYSNIITLITIVLHSLLQVRRIRTVVMFLSKQEREMMRDVVEEVFKEGDLKKLGSDELGTRDAWRSMLK